MDIPGRLRYLLERYAENSCSREELGELFSKIRQAKTNDELYAFLQNNWNDLTIDGSSPEIDWNKMFEQIISSTPRRRRVARSWWAAAAAVVLLVAGYWFLIRETSNVKRENAIAISHDVKAPGANRAVVTLSNGQKIYLDSSSNGRLAIQNNTTLEKTADGHLIYSSRPGAQNQQITYNTLSNPRGSRVIDLVLSDGTHVWLNAESSITYPVTFTTGERKVQITGEAYFEVVHDSKRPFRVSANGVEVEDLGTEFNVAAYADETENKTTLLKGKVQVTSGKQSEILKPGEQASLSSAGNMQLKTNVDLNEVTSWKDNRFYFMSADIKTIMRELARWYDVDVEYKDQITNHFTGIISRNVNASEVFNMLSQTGVVHFEINGKKVTVSPEKK